MTEEEKQGAVSAAPMEMLNALLSNPELLQRVGSLLGGLGAASVPTSAEGEAAGESSAKGETESASSSASPAGGMAEGLGAVLSNPAMLEKLPEIMAVMKPLLSAPPTQNATASGGSAANDRERLLLALKPFLSAQRREAVDSILRISRLGATLQLLK